MRTQARRPLGRHARSPSAACRRSTPGKSGPSGSRSSRGRRVASIASTSTSGEFDPQGGPGLRRGRPKPDAPGSARRSRPRAPSPRRRRGRPTSRAIEAGACKRAAGAGQTASTCSEVGGTISTGSPRAGDGREGRGRGSGPMLAGISDDEAGGGTPRRPRLGAWPRAGRPRPRSQHADRARAQAGR